MQFAGDNNSSTYPLEEKVMRLEKLSSKLRALKVRNVKISMRRRAKTAKLIAQVEEIENEINQETEKRIERWGDEVPVWIRMNIVASGGISFIWIFLTLGSFKDALYHLYGNTKYLTNYRHYFSVVSTIANKIDSKKHMTCPSANMLDHGSVANLVVCLDRHFALRKDNSALSKLYTELVDIEMTEIPREQDIPGDKMCQLFGAYDTEKY